MTEDDTPRHLRLASNTTTPKPKRWRAKHPSDAEQLVCPKCNNSEFIETRNLIFIKAGKASRGSRNLRCSRCNTLAWSG